MKALSITQGSLYDQVKQQIDEAITYYKELSKDGWQASEVFALAHSGITTLVSIVQQVVGYSPEDRKAVVLEAAGRLYDEVIAPIDIPSIPNFIENRVVDPYLRGVFLKIAAGVIDSITKVMGKLGAAGFQPPVATPPALPSGFTPY